VTGRVAARVAERAKSEGRFSRIIRKALRAPLDRRGYYLLKKHYNLPIPDEADRRAAFLDADSELPGLELSEDRSFAFFDDVVAPALPDFRTSFSVEPDRSKLFSVVNGSFMAVDAHVLWGVLRGRRPNRLIEVGAGESTRLAAEAAVRNMAEGSPLAITTIDPFPATHLAGRSGEGFRLIPARVQDVGLDMFSELERGDVLFIDSTHALREGGDVQFLYCEVLPRLSEGVLVHVHDISLPRRYPTVYYEQDLFWNEQYLLQAFLAFNSRFEVLWPGNWIAVYHYARLHAAFPELDAMRASYPLSEPSSFWMVVRG
jgi:hypothetical protein